MVFDTDEHVDRTLTMENLAEFTTPFKENGTVTIANASGICDAAAAAVLMSAKKAKELGVKPLMKLINVCTEGMPPDMMGLGPAVSIPKCLRQAGMKFDDVEYWEINEAFAVQFLGVGRMFKEELGIELDLDTINHNGSGISLGHPVGATGMRLIVSLYYELERLGLTVGGASLCVGGGPSMASRDRDAGRASLVCEAARRPRRASRLRRRGRSVPLQYKVFRHGYLGFNSNSILIYGEKDAILIDSSMLLSDSYRLVSELIPLKKRITHIYVSHFHPDHHFGLRGAAIRLSRREDRRASERCQRHSLHRKRQTRDVGQRLDRPRRSRQDDHPQSHEGASSVARGRGDTRLRWLGGRLRQQLGGVDPVAQSRLRDRRGLPRCSPLDRREQRRAAAEVAQGHPPVHGVRPTRHHPRALRGGADADPRGAAGGQARSYTESVDWSMPVPGHHTRRSTRRPSRGRRWPTCC